MKLKINGTDITSYIKYQGVQWSLNSIDAEGSGRNLNGLMQRKKIADKNKFEISCRALTTREMALLNNLLSGQYVSVEYTTNTGTLTFTMYPGATIKAAVFIIRDDGTEVWDGYSFSLIER